MSASSVFLIYDKGTKSLLYEVFPDTLDQEQDPNLFSLTPGQGVLKVPLAVYPGPSLIPAYILANG